MGVARAFEVTVMQIIVPALVPLPLVPRAVAGSATANQTATIAGPALGGFLYAAGPAIVYGTCLALFIVAGLLLEGRIKERGVLPPELCVPVDPFLKALAARGMPVRVSITRSWRNG